MESNYQKTRLVSSVALPLFVSLHLDTVHSKTDISNCLSIFDRYYPVFFKGIHA